MATDDAAFLSGSTVSLRPMVPDDATGEYVRWMNDAEVVRYLESGHRPTTETDLTEYIERKRADDDVVLLAIEDRESGEHVGNVKLGPINWVHRRASVGLLIGAKERWGEGIGTDAVSLVTEYAFERLDLQRVFAHCFAPNEGSIRVFEKAGYEAEGTLANHAFVDGHRVDVVVMGITA